MTSYAALLRAVNVGGTGKLPMDDLRATCARLGFGGVRTYLASGNVVFESGEDAVTVKHALETALADYAGRPVAVFVRTDAEMSAIVAGNPFPDAPPARVAVHFLDVPLPEGLLDGIRGRSGEEIAPGRRELYVHYVNGMGRSRLVIPAARAGTARNMNTVAKLAALATRR